MDLRLAVWMTLLALIAGCSKGGVPTYPVGGTVTIRGGKPLHGGTVEFQPVGDQHGKVSARGQIQPDGKYKMSTFSEDDGAVEGKQRVLVTSPLPPGPINPEKPAKPVINPKYQSFDTSGLEFTVNPDGENKFDITVDPP